MRLETMMDVYAHELKDLYNAEMRLIEALPRMAARASAPQLREAFDALLTRSRSHRDRLKRIFRKLDVRPTGADCQAMDGLLREAEQILGASGSGEAIDTSLVAMASRIEHYQIAGYGAAASHARRLGRDDDVELLEQTREEEEEADRDLVELATYELNRALVGA